MWWNELLTNLFTLDYLDCDDLPSLAVGNVTKWGCSVAHDQSDCLINNTWTSDCCMWKDEECVSKKIGPNKVFISWVWINNNFIIRQHLWLPYTFFYRCLCPIFQNGMYKCKYRTGLTTRWWWKGIYCQLSDQRLLRHRWNSLLWKWRIRSRATNNSCETSLPT